MERQYTRLDQARKLIDDIIKNIADEEDKRSAYVHLYGVGLMASLIALKRGYSREIAEMAEISGMLHDLLKYVDKTKNVPDHGPLCAEYARIHVLDKMDCFNDEEKLMIYNGVYNHSHKNTKGFYFDEIVKDADAIQHSLRNPMEDFWFDKPRTKQVIDEVI